MSEDASPDSWALPYDPLPLARFGGARPPAPAWFNNALSQAPDRSFFTVDGKSIEMLCWGDVERPGLLFLHGNGAHADWWSFITPFFAHDWRCAAISWSGMGSSDWSERYSFEGYAAEAMAAITAAKLDSGGRGVIIVAHSLGGNPAMIAGARDPRVRGVICIDTAISPRYAQPAARQPQLGRNRLYPDLASALARFRLDPPQSSENLYILDHLARHALCQVEDDRGAGWTWRFDPSMWSRLDRTGIPQLPGGVACPMAYMYGGRSRLIDAEILDFIAGVLPPDAPVISIPDADHHVLADQPLALVGALRGLLPTWPERRSPEFNAQE